MKRNLYIMYAIVFLQGMVFYAPIATLYRQIHGITIFQITFIESVSLALAIFLEVPWGIVADRIGYRKSMIICSGLYFISKIIFLKATNFEGFLLERIILSVVLAGYSGVDTSIIYLSCNGKDSQKVFGIYNCLGMLGLLVSAGVFSLFIQDNYFLAAMLTVISYGFASLLSFGICEVKQFKNNEFKSNGLRSIIKNNLGNKSLILFLVAVAFMLESHQTITVFLNQLQYERCGLSDFNIGIVYIIATLLGLVSIYSIVITKRIGTYRSLVLFCVLAIFSCSILTITSNAFLSIGAILFLRISNALFQPLQLEIQNKQIEIADRATALSINSMFINCIAITTNLIFGLLANRYLPMAFFFGSQICLFSLIFFSLWYKRALN